MDKLCNIKNIYMIGIGGASMSALAIALKNFGYTVVGSDRAKGEYTDLLQKNNIEIYYTQNFEKIAECDCVVYNAAIAANHAEYLYAKSNLIPLIPRAEILQCLINQFKNSIAVAGCHGKSSTSAMIMHMLQACTHNASMHIGAKDKVYNNFYFGGKEFFVTEACEYKQNFLALYPDVAVILNTDNDHMECYTNTESLQKSYMQFAKQAKYVIVYDKDILRESLMPDYTFGFSDSADICAKNIYTKGGKSSFKLVVQGEEIGRVHLKVYGKFAIQHALATFAVAKLYNLNMQTAINAVENFTGIARRMEVLQADKCVQVIADYAHHPTEVMASIQTVKKIAKGRLHILFQPHTYSRTIYFFDEFVKILGQEEHVVLFKTFSARERYRKKGSAKTLANFLKTIQKDVLYIETERQLVEYYKNTIEKGDTLLCLGAGNIYMLVQNMLRKIQKSSKDKKQNKTSK